MFCCKMLIYAVLSRSTCFCVEKNSGKNYAPRGEKITYMRYESHMLMMRKSSRCPRKPSLVGVGGFCLSSRS